MAGVGKAFSVGTLTNLALAGAGSVAAAIVQSSLPVTTVSDNVRDAALVAVAALAIAMGGGAIRSFGVGFGAAVVGSLVRRNILVG